MPSISNSLKKLKQKREDFNLKMNDLMKLDATYTTANSNHDASMSDSSLDNETFTIPKQLYNASSDIVCQAFRSEVLLNSIPPVIPVKILPHKRRRIALLFIQCTLARLMMMLHQMQVYFRIY